MPSIQALLNDAIAQLAAVSDSAQLDAEVLLAHILDKPRSHLRAWPDKALSSQSCADFLTLLQQRLKGIPIAYLTGTKEFWSREFLVSPEVLIPRPDTECLIELSLALISDHAIMQVLDLGTGSGIIAITLAAECPQLQVTASDASMAALAVARQNAQHLQTANIQFIHSDWFEQIPPAKFDLIVSNPPYIAEGDPHLQQGDVRFEPLSALRAADQGLSDIRSLAEQARLYFNSPGHLLMEHGYNQQAQVQDIFSRLGYAKVTTHFDLSGNARVTYGYWQG